MSEKSPEDIAELVKFLTDQGLDEATAEEWLKDKVVYQQCQVPAKALRDVLNAAVLVGGIPALPVVVTFMVPQKKTGEFKDQLQAALAKHGGFVWTAEEKAALEGLKPEQMN